MSSGKDWTHHWLMTNMGPSGNDSEDDVTIHQSTDPYITQCHLEDDPLGMAHVQAPDEGISTSPVTSIDLERDSPMACGIDDEDAGPPSIETQPPDNSDDLEVSGITSTWISSGGHYGGTHPGLGYSTLGSEMVGINSDTTEVNIIPGLEGGDFNADLPPVYGPALPIGPFNSPVREPSPSVFGDVADESASSGLCGLRNLGNTCFMAAGIQCLVNTPPIAQYFFNHHLDSDEAKSSLAGCFSQLTHKIWSGKFSSLRPSEFKEAFGLHCRDFRDYRQHDCQEFMTLLLEALRKQMPLREEDGSVSPLRETIADSVTEKSLSITSIGHPSCASSFSSSRSSSHVDGSRGSRGSTSPSPPQSPQCPQSPVSPISLKQQSFEMRSDVPEDPIGLDSGAASPKSSVSSSSVDAHLINLRLQPIPEEVKTLNRVTKINMSSDDLSLAGNVSCHDAESVTSDMSDSGVDSANLLAGVAAVRRYNHLSTTNDVCDMSGEVSLGKSISNIYVSSASGTVPSHCLPEACCDSFSANTSIPLTDEGRGSTSQSWDTHDCSILEKNQKFSLGKVPNPGNHLSMVKLEDIMKETKTSNVNVLAKDNVSNNEFLYDSEKYAKVESKKLKNSVDNLSRAGLKRVKEVNLLVDKMDNSQLDSSLISSNNKQSTKACSSAGRNSILALNKRIRLEEKNVQYELGKGQTDYYDRISEALPSTSSIHDHRILAPSSSISSEEQRTADDSWKSFVGDSKSAVVDTFYGQFKSSLVCSVCGHTSIKFDPFGTLSVPLPHANEIQIPLTYVPHDGMKPTHCLITLFKVSTVQEIKSALVKLLGPTDDEIVIAEVFDNHIARTVEDSYLTKFLNHTLRSIYAFKLAPPPLCNNQDPEINTNENNPTTSTAEMPDHNVDLSHFDNDGLCAGASNSTVVDEQWQACNICLEELCQTDLKTHESCEDCVLCDSCIEMSCKHHGGESLPCPVCHTLLNPSDLIPVAKRKADKPKARILRVPVVYRIDTESDDNNKREMQLVGHPCLLSLPSRIKPNALFEIIERKLLKGTTFSLLLVDGRGYNCSRCLFSSHCRGCETIRGSSEITLQAGDTICVRFKGISLKQREDLSRMMEHPSLVGMRLNEPLTIYDCLRAFTQSETLEESESWFCPKCERKQQATKTISVWKYPPYLIIHLERFLFHGTLSTKVDDKVIFPIDGLDLSDFVAGEQPSSLLYNLYSCVCHMGVAQAGHYTALVRSPVTNEWHYFNDDSVTRQKPRDEEYSTSYLLFYHRQGTLFDLCLPQSFAFINSPPKVQSSLEEAVVGSSSDKKDSRKSYKRMCVESLVVNEDIDGGRTLLQPFGRDEHVEDSLLRKSSCGSKTCSNVESLTSVSSLPSVSSFSSPTSGKSIMPSYKNAYPMDSSEEFYPMDTEMSHTLVIDNKLAAGDFESFSGGLHTDQSDCDNASANMEE